MKKLIAVALILVLSLSLLAGCKNETKKATEENDYTVDPVTGYTAGVVEDNVYTNETLGIKYTGAENTFMSGKEEINEMMSLTADDEQSFMYEMLLYDDQGNNIIVLSERLADPDETEADYIDDIKQQLIDINMVDVEFIDAYEYYIGDLKFSVLRYPMTIAISEEEMEQYLLVHKYADRIFAMTVTCQNAADFEVLMSDFSTIDSEA